VCVIAGRRCASGVVGPPYFHCREGEELQSVCVVEQSGKADRRR
jgi:hypothetical protein